VQIDISIVEQKSSYWREWL